jgi:hypothetical protein
MVSIEAPMSVCTHADACEKRGPTCRDLVPPPRARPRPNLNGVLLCCPLEGTFAGETSDPVTSLPRRRSEGAGFWGDRPHGGDGP